MNLNFVDICFQLFSSKSNLDQLLLCSKWMYWLRAITELIVFCLQYNNMYSYVLLWTYIFLIVHM